MKQYQARVVIHLMGGDYANVWFETEDEALVFIGAWLQRGLDRVKNGTWQEIETGVYGALLDGKATWGVKAQYIMGMTLQPVVMNEKAQKLMESQTKFFDTVVKNTEEGDEWKADD